MHVLHTVYSFRHVQNVEINKNDTHRNHFIDRLSDTIISLERILYIFRLERRVVSQFLVEFLHEVAVGVDVSVEGFELLQLSLLFG